MKNVLFLALLFLFWNSAYAQTKPLVVVTTYPLYEVMTRVGGDTVNVEKLVPNGSDVHLFRLSPKMIIATGRASLFVYSGAGLESWAEPLLTNLPKSTKVVDMSHHVKLRHYERSEAESHHGHEHHHGHDENEAGHLVDPHYWLDVENMIRMSETAVSELSALQPKHTSLYKANAQTYIQALRDLQSRYHQMLSQCGQDVIVSNHDAFGYLAKANGFHTVAITGLSPEHRPSAKVLAEVMTLVKEKRIKTVFFEAFVSSNVAEALGRETGTTVESLQPLANLSADEVASNANYITIMDENLKKIANALECH